MIEDGSAFFELSELEQNTLVASARCTKPVNGLTHNYYRYPARFSPTFVRAAIEAFTEPGDHVLDPYVGGGTTAVEAMVLGRHAIGVDISELAQFVTNVKTTVLSEKEIQLLESWTAALAKKINLRRKSRRLIEYHERGYYKHLHHPSRWRLRKAIELALAYAQRLTTPNAEAFARCVILRTAQWALDGRKTLPSVSEFRATLSKNASEMTAAARLVRTAARSHAILPKVRTFRRSTTGIEKDSRISVLPAPKLVVTSPPYPGIHVLYHRWQVDGRKEAALPFMIANKLDGEGGSYYTMGDRKNPGLVSYFENIQASMSSVAALADEDTIIVQMVAFSAPEWQLPRYLEAMLNAGLSEMLLPVLRHHGDGRLWRSVPGRRWYSAQRGETPGSQEVVLFHKRSNSASQHIVKVVTAQQYPLA